MIIAQQIGRNIKVWRVKRDLTQEQLALASNVDTTYLSGVERGKHNVSIETLVKLARALSCGLVDLLEDVEQLHG